MNTVKQESLRLSSSDFQLRVIVEHPRIREDPGPSQNPVHIKGNLGDAFFHAELVNLDSPRLVRAGRGSSGRIGHRYYAQNFTFGGIEGYPYLNSLEGQTFNLMLPLDQLQYLEGDLNWEYYVDLYIKGRHVKGSPDAMNKVEIVIEFGEDQIQ